MQLAGLCAEHARNARRETATPALPGPPPAPISNQDNSPAKPKVISKTGKAGIK